MIVLALPSGIEEISVSAPIAVVGYVTLRDCFSETCEAN